MFNSNKKLRRISTATKIDLYDNRHYLDHSQNTYFTSVKKPHTSNKNF